MDEGWKTVSRAQLKSLYERKTAPEIAAMFDITHGAVYYKLRVFGLDYRRSGVSHTRGPKRGFNPPKEELEALYGRMSMADVAKHYGVGETVIFHRIRDYGIPIINRSKRLTGRPKTLAHRIAMSKSKIGLQMGENHPNWKGGITSLNKRARSQKAYHEWKSAVLAKSDYKCCVCGREHGAMCDCCGHVIYLHAHHLEPFAENIELRYDPANGKALCERCHSIEHNQKIG